MHGPAPHETTPHETHGGTVPHDGSPGEMLASLTQAPATKLPSYLSTVKAASPGAFDKQRKVAQDGLPKVPAPTGLPPKEAAGKKCPDRPAPGRAKEAAALAGGKSPPKGHDEVPEAPPPPPTTPSHLAGDEAPLAATAQGETPRDPAMEKSAQAAVEQVSLPSDQVPTRAGAPPAVDLTGDADPAQMQNAEHTGAADVATHHQHALAEVGVDRGEKDIAPKPDHDVLHADLKVGAGGSPGGAGPVDHHAELPPEALASIDAHASPLLHEKIGAEKEKYTSADAEYHAGSEKAKADATTKTADLETEAKASQNEARGAAQAEVAGARADWQGEIEGVHKKFKTDAAAASSEHGEQIRGHAETGNREATQHMQKAEADAATERKKAEGEAEKKKGEAKKDSGGFWGWVKDKAKALVDGLKAAVNFIYDNLRKAVKTLFEAAQKLAMAAIEVARRAIVGLIKAFGAVLKVLVSVALAAFPELRDKMLKRIDAAVNRAVDLVNKAAAGLKKAVAAVLDFLAKTIDSLLKLVQDIYNGILTVVGMIVSGEFAELLQKLANLVAAAKTAPGQFETAAYEQLLGGDLDEPLSPGELIAAGRLPPGLATGPGGAEPMGGSEKHEGEGAEDEGPHPPWTESNVGVENVASGVPLSPELEDELAARTGDNGAVEFGNSNGADRNMENILGIAPGQAPGQGGEDPQTQQGPHAVDGLTPRERAEVKWTLMKQGLAKWWSDNWPYVIGGGVLAVAGFIVANIFTGGAILAALPTLMTVVGYLFTGMLVVQLVGYVRDFLQKGWAGDTRGGGKALASALAAGAIELISWLTFKAGSAALKGAKAAAKGVAKGAQAVAQVGARAARGAVNLVKRGTNFLIKGSKVLLRGAGDAIGRAVKSLRELGEKLLAKTKFKGFRFRIEGKRWELEGRINPWVLLATGQVDFRKRQGGTLGSRTTVPSAEGAQDAIVIGQLNDTALRDLFQGMSQADAQAAYQLLKRGDLRPQAILKTLKTMERQAAEKVLQDLHQFKHVDEAQLRQIINDYRKETEISKLNSEGDVTGGTVAAGKTEVPTHNINATHHGASAEAQTAPKHFDDTFQSPQTDARARNHAEQTVLGQSAREIEAAVEQRLRSALGNQAKDLEVLAAARRVAEEQLQGTLKITVDQAMCSACRQGFDSSVDAGIIKQFSDRFKNMTIYLTADGTTEIVIVQGGKILR